MGFLKGGLGLIKKKRLADLVPINWLDPLLTGPDKALTGTAGKWECSDIENLLKAVRQRILIAEKEKTDD